MPDSDTTKVLAINYADGWAQLLAYYGGSWHYLWGNSGSHWISGWYLSLADKYLPGNFVGNANGQKGLLAIATNGDGFEELLQYSATKGDWSIVWGNNGSGKIHLWYLHPSDQYLVGSFDGGKQDQLLAVATNGWTHLMSYSGPDWDTPWSNDGSGTIDLWYMHPTDKYVPGDFNGDGKADLFAVATNGWAHLMERRLP